METASISNTEKNDSKRLKYPDPAIFQNKHIIVIIPCYNEERFIGSVLLKLRRFPVEIIVVDDGSTDKTAVVAAAADVDVIRLQENQGKGSALREGFEKARELNPDVIITIDGDGQHLPEELPQMLQPILSSMCDIVIGSRYLNAQNQIPAHRRFGHLLFRLANTLITREKIKDTQSGYRSFSRHAIQEIDIQSRGFEVESEIQIIAQTNGLRLMEVPITVLYTDPPKRSVVQQGVSVLKGTLGLTAQYHPLLFFSIPGLILFVFVMVWDTWLVEHSFVTPQWAARFTRLSLSLSMISLSLICVGIFLQYIRSFLLGLQTSFRKG